MFEMKLRLMGGSCLCVAPLCHSAPATPTHSEQPRKRFKPHMLLFCSSASRASDIKPQTSFHCLHQLISPAAPSAHLTSWKPSVPLFLYHQSDKLISATSSSASPPPHQRERRRSEAERRVQLRDFDVLMQTGLVALVGSESND